MRLAPGQRDTILQEMGIQTYVPRMPLPGARPSPIRPAGVADVPLPDVVELRPAVVERPAVTSLPDMRVTAPSAQAPAVAVPMAAAEVSAEAVNFAFAYVPVNEHLAVICELPWARSAVLTPSCRQLLADMLKAIGAPCEADRLSPMVFSWPLSDAGDMPQDVQSARHMLEGFLSRRLKLRAVPHWLLLAEHSAHFLFPVAEQPPASGLQVHPRFPVQVLVTHSLHAMEAVRDLKRAAWQALQPLKLSLAEAAGQGQRSQV